MPAEMSYNTHLEAHPTKFAMIKKDWAVLPVHHANHVLIIMYFLHESTNTPFCDANTPTVDHPIHQGMI